MTTITARRGLAIRLSATVIPACAGVLTLAGCLAEAPADLSAEGGVDAGGGGGDAKPGSTLPEADATRTDAGSGGDASNDGGTSESALGDATSGGDAPPIDGTAVADATPADSTSTDAPVQDAPGMDSTAEACPVNACSGCGALSATPGAACGTCGTYVCTTDKTAVTCNDPGTTNNCPTWCTSHPAPSGVAATDYACADFDKGVLPSGWTQTKSGSASLSVSMARANSTPDSLLTSVTANSADVATLAFSPAPGAASITSLSLSAEIDPVTAAQIVPTGSPGMDLLKISCGGNTVHLGYTEQGTDPSGGSNPYTGLYVYWVVVAGAAVAGMCPVTANLNLNVWNAVELDLDISNLGAISVIINGTTATSGCAASNSTDTVATMTVGLNGPSADT
ncbi:MAG TPA: hypothetical protein VKU41_02770, partial [Polyangiaceae bacterium]|nr:hypothetical protein [Polyangiaceae bacterium]